MISYCDLNSNDLDRIKQSVQKSKEKNFVKNRIEKNLADPTKNITKQEFWKALVCCLLTTQQKSGPDSAVTRFICSEPFKLRYETCLEIQQNLQEYAEDLLTRFGGIRRTKTIAREVNSNLEWLEKRYGWQQIFDTLEQLNNSPTKSEERMAAEYIDDNLFGFGPKQARNLLQLLGLTKYEIPIDSRILKWFEGYGLKVETQYDLSNKKQYNKIIDYIQNICEKIEEYPCVLDAAIFSSYDTEWDENKLIW